MGNEIVLNEFVDAPKKKLRDPNFELLRIISMFLIVSVHFLGFGGFLENTVGANHIAARILNAVFPVSVNEFVMISAYFLCKSERLGIDWRKFLKLWLTVFFYQIVIFTIFAALGIIKLNAMAFVRAFLPILGREYWFASAYLIMLLAAPFLNMIVKNASKKQLFFIVCCIFALCVFGTDLNLLGEDSTFGNIFHLADGYSAVWFICLYFITAYIRHYVYEFPTFILVLLFFVYIGLTSLMYFGYSRAYSSGACVAASVIVFFIFRQIKIKSPSITKIICAVSPLMFGVYLIHMNHYVADVLYKDIFRTQRYFSNEFSFLIMIGFILLTMLVCAAIEFIRQKGFDLISITLGKIISKIKSKKQSYEKAG